MATVAETRERDIHMLRELVAADVAEAEANDDDCQEWGSAETVTEEEHEAFEGMLRDLRGAYQTLTEKRRAFAEGVCKRLSINTTPPAQRKAIPRGAPVELAEVLRVLPKRPPHSRRP